MRTIASVERLVAEFPMVPTRTVALVVTECVARFPQSSAWFIEQAARARLQPFAAR